MKTSTGNRTSGAKVKKPAKRTTAKASTGKRASGAKAKKPTRGTTAKATSRSKSTGTVLLSGGNPQIAKGYGAGPVREYIAAMPGWKNAVGRRLDKLIVEAVPKVEKAVKWNSPFYGMEKDVWFLSFHCMTKYVKVAFFRGASLRPRPPGLSKHKRVRYLDVYEDTDLDEAQFVDWVKQASRLPGERM